MTNVFENRKDKCGPVGRHRMFDVRKCIRLNCMHVCCAVLCAPIVGMAYGIQYDVRMSDGCVVVVSVWRKGFVHVCRIARCCAQIQSNLRSQCGWSMRFSDTISVDLIVNFVFIDELFN